jgi:hypothetical protein
MSEKPFGGVTSECELMPAFDAGAKAMCVSGSYPPPGQFVPPPRLPMLSDPSSPSAFPRIGGLKSGPGLYRDNWESAFARSSGVKSMMSSGMLSKFLA